MTVYRIQERDEAVKTDYGGKSLDGAHFFDCHSFLDDAPLSCVL